MTNTDRVAIFVVIPRHLRTRIRVAAAMREESITTYVARALESALGASGEVRGSGAA